MILRSSRAATTVVFVNFRSEELIAPRAAALLEAGFDVVVADNSGTYVGPGGVVTTDGNIGFGAAVNRAVATLPATNEWICLHNPDASIAPEDLDRLVASMAGVHRPGAAVGAERDGAVVRLNGYRRPAFFREVLLVGRALVRSRRQAGTTSAIGRGTGPKRGGGPRFGSASLLLLARGAFEAVGGFDEGFFLYGEDLDLWVRLEEAGYDMRFVPDVVFDHANATASPMGWGDRELLRWAGVELYLQRHGRRWRPHRLLHVASARVLPRSSAAVGAARLAWRAGRSPEEAMAAIVEAARR